MHKSNVSKLVQHIREVVSCKSRNKIYVPVLGPKVKINRYVLLNYSRLNSYAPELVPIVYYAIKHGYI